jgi:hypothetical protein
LTIVTIGRSVDAGVYIGHALPVVQQQLLSPGIRLAKIIDENF